MAFISEQYLVQRVPLLEVLLLLIRVLVCGGDGGLFAVPTISILKELTYYLERSNSLAP